MFYCEPCRIKRDWPRSLAGSYGQCELCDEVASCWDRPSRTLPLPKEFPKVEKAQKINYARLNDFLGLFTKEERAEWGRNGQKAPDWILSGMLWFMANDPGHQELMRRLRDS